jgi:predicted dehydrogenase
MSRTGVDAPLRIGILGAARVAPCALIEPAHRVGGIAVVAVASRSLEKAQAFATSYAVPKTFDSYASLLADEEIDAVYVALPPSLHAEWTMRAFDHGKHVLCEKPMAMHAPQGEEMAARARASGCVLQEAMHTHFSRVFQRQRDLVRDGTLGRIVRIASTLRLPNVPMIDGDFRMQARLGGGAGMDLGCYAAAGLRYIAGEEPDVVDAMCRSRVPEIDDWMQASVVLPSGATGVIECGFHGEFAPRLAVEIDCERGTIRRGAGGLVVTRDGQASHEAVSLVNTYEQQLEAFVRQIRGEPSNAPAPEEAIRTARVLDAMYQRAGLAPRGD